MDTRLRSITFLVLLLLASFFSSMPSASEARPLHDLSLRKNDIKEVDGILRTLKSSGPSPGGGHKHEKIQNLGVSKNSGPSPGAGHSVKTLGVKDVGVVKHSGPIPGEGHKYIMGGNS